jgi:alkanesulfonate monooxygenase SsuD/methylene tetrahydromethanopterin reductase-like flavin-dependent oxidoreductase (luciferase family)
VGVWSPAFVLAPAAEMRAAAAEIEALGYGAVWFPEGFGTKE